MATKTKTATPPQIDFNPGDPDWADAPDGDFQRSRFSLIHPLSHVLQAGNMGYVAGLAAGMFHLNDLNNGVQIFPATGVDFQMVAAQKIYVTRSGEDIIDASPLLPAGAHWTDNPEKPGKKMFVDASGDKIEKTMYLHIFIDGVPAVMRCAKTAFKQAEPLVAVADATRVMLGKHEVRHVGLKAHVSSTSQSGGGHTWFEPRFSKIGVYPDKAAGLTTDQVVRAAELRVELEKGFSASLAEAKALALQMRPPQQQIAYGHGRAQGTTTITSGRQQPDPIDDNIDDLPWMNRDTDKKAS
jgi:hypothetical protein